MTREELAVDQEETLEAQNADGAEESEPSKEELAKARLKEAVIVSREELGSLRLKLTVTVPREIIDERLAEQFTELKRDALVPGFRKGHAPLRLVEKRFAADVGDQLKSQLVSNGYMAAVEKEELNPLGDPLFWVKTEEERVGENQVSKTIEVEKLLPIDQALDHILLPKTGELTFACEMELRPTFDLPNLAGIPVERPRITIDDEDVEAELKNMRMMRGTYQPVESGTVERNDLLYTDMKMTVDGQTVLKEENYDVAARDMRIHEVPLVGLGDALIGKRIGDDVSVQATVQDDHKNIDIRGKTATFEFKIQEIKRLEVPPFDAEFLANAGYESEDELRQAVRGAMESRLDGVINQAMREQVGKYLLESTKLEIPPGLSQRQTDRSIARRMVEMYRQGVPQTEIEKSLDELKAKAHDQTLRDLHLFFILEKIAEDRDITVSEERINSAIAQIAARSHKRFDRVRDELSKGDGLTSLYLQLRDEQILDALLEEATITETEGPKKRSAKKAEKKEPKEVPAATDEAPKAKPKRPKKTDKKS